MAAKRALIVDDSKSARAALARVLEQHSIGVDTAESAEAAIEYLAHQRPDVIFMDQMMPGMDGLEAVKEIKSNPATATIPIMMYTSQEGEVYLGQARALGAVGVLPKQTKPADVTKVLYQLHLLPDRRSAERVVFPSATLAELAAAAEAAATGTFASSTFMGPKLPTAGLPAGAPATEALLREQLAELRRASSAALDAQGDRITADIRAMLLEMQPQPVVERRGVGARAGWIAAALAIALALGTGALWQQEAARYRELSTELDNLRQTQSGGVAESQAWRNALSEELETRHGELLAEMANLRDELASLAAAVRTRRAPAAAIPQPEGQNVPGSTAAGSGAANN